MALFRLLFYTIFLCFVLLNYRLGRPSSFCLYDVAHKFFSQIFCSLKCSFQCWTRFRK